MQIKTTYIGKLNGINGVWCDFKPENLIVKEEYSVLYPSPNKKLKHKQTQEIFNSVLLINGEVKENYTEI